MTRRSFPHPFSSPSAAVVLAFVATSMSVAPASLRAQDLAPGTPDESFSISRVRNPTFLPAQTNFTPFALTLQPGQDPVQEAVPNVREIPAAQTKLIIGGDAAALIRTFLTRTVRAATNYDSTGVPVTTFTAPFEPGDFDPVFFASPASNNGFGNGARIAYTLASNPDGGLLVGGLFGPTALTTSVFYKQQKNFILLNLNGDPQVTLDASGTVVQSVFNANLGAGANDSVLAILRRSTLVPGENAGRLVLGGQFIRFNKQDRGRVTQLLPDGTSDVDFNRNLGTGASGIVFSLAEDTRLVAVGVDPIDGLPIAGPSQQIYVCGDFDSFNGKAPGKLVRLNADGTVDPSFAPKIVGRAIAVAIQADGKILLGGDLDTINGTAVNNIARLFPDGTLDPVFLANATASLSSPNNIPPTSIYVLRVQPDGRILVGGNYLNLDQTLRRYLGRLNSDGTLDTTFDAGNTLSQANQSIVFVPRDPAGSPGLATDLIYAQTRADRKQVPGDTGFFPDPVRRLFGDSPAGNVFGFPDSLAQVRLTADGPTATVGDLRPTTDSTLFAGPVPNPGTPGLFRITREGNLANDLVVRVKVLNPTVNVPATPGLNTRYRLRQFIFTPVTTTSDSGASTTVVTTTVTDPLGATFNAVIPAGERSASILVEGITDGIFQPDEAVTLKIRGSADGSYVKRAGQASATVTVLANNL